MFLAVGRLAAGETSPKTASGAPQTIKLLEAGQPVTIVCFGDSVTGVYYHTGDRRAWPDLLGLALRRLYPRAQLTVINAGISGNSTADGLQRMEADVLRHHPQLVIAMFGLNDVTRVSEEVFRANLRTIVGRSRSVGAEVILMTPNFVSGGDPIRPLEKVARYAQITRDARAELNVPVADPFRAFEPIEHADHRTWIRLMSDADHPNMRGHKILAEVAVKSLTGQSVLLPELPRLQPGMPRVLARLQAGETVRVIAMKPYDDLITPALKALYPGARVDVTSWDVAGKTLSEIEKEAGTLGWPKYRKAPELTPPDLFILAVPADASSPNDDQFVRDYTWIMNWSLSFTPPGWDCLVVLPSVARSTPSDLQRAGDAAALDVILGQDLPWLQRAPGDQTPAAELLQRKLDELLEAPKS